MEAVGNELSSGVLAIDALNRNIGNQSLVLDQRALLYLNEMERQAWYRLKKYHYYLAKSYEYRTLNPYEGGLNVAAVYEKVIELAKSANNNPVLNKEYIGTALVALYQEQLNAIRDKILTDFNNGAPQPSSTGRDFHLTREELNVLNQSGSLVINLAERGLFPPNREDIRITSLEVKHVQASSGNTGGYLQTEFSVLYPAFSKIKKGGKVFYFSYNKEWNENIKWRADYFLNQPQVENHKPSRDFESLLKSLLPTLDEEAVVQIRPSAWAYLTLRKADYENGFERNSFIRVDSLVFRVGYDYISSEAQTAFVEVSTSEEWMTPHLKVSRTDLKTRKDGRGNFFRTYYKNTHVVLTAPQWYGRWKFTGWTESGRQIAGAADTSVALVLSRDRIVIRPIL